MEYDEEKVDEMVLALRFIHDPKSKARSVILTEEGERATRELFERHFGR